MTSYYEQAFEAYRKTAQLTCLVGSLMDSDAEGLNRNHAICCGLLIRISKFMLVAITMSSKHCNGDVTFSLTRMIQESAINLRYLLRKGDDETFDRYVRASLAPDRELFDIIQANIQKRGDGSVLEIEQNMLDSIRDRFASSGVEVGDIDPRGRDIAFAGKLEYLKNKGLITNARSVYLTYRMGSHAVHGTWMDSLFNHLDYADGGFQPNTEHYKNEGKLFNPTCAVVIPALMDYLEFFFGDTQEAQSIRADLSDLLVGTHVAEVSAPDWDWVDGSET